MKRGITIIFILGVVSLLVLSAYMPYLTTQALDYQLEQKIIYKEDASMSLVLNQSYDFFHLMETFTTEQFQVELEEGYEMTIEAVEDAAIEIMNSLLIAGLIEQEVYLPPGIVPILSVSVSDMPALSGVFWQCVWSNASGKQNILWLDDKSGKMIAFEGQIAEPNRKGYDTTIEEDTDIFTIPIIMSDDAKTYDTIASDVNGYSAAVAIAAFCRRYYQLDNVICIFEKQDDNYSSFTLILVKEENGQTNTYTIPIRIRGNLLYFNM